MNSPRPTTVAVVGATGQQGSATVQGLLELGMTVRALTRNPDDEHGRTLKAKDVEVVAADLDAPASIVDAFSGISAAFAMTTFAGSDGPAGEVAHGQVIGDAARTAGVPLLLYSSVGGAERHTEIPHFESKARVERYLTGLVPLNIVRPVFFMENLLGMIARDDDGWVVRMPLPADVELQMISVRDIGRAAAALLARADPQAAPVEIAGDELSGDQIARRLGERLNAPARYEALPLEVLGDDEDSTAMFAWFTHLPAFQADFTRTRELVPDVEDLTAWLSRQSIG